MDGSNDVRASLAADVVVKVVGDGAVLVSMKTGRCWELNRTGLEIWRLFEQGLAAQEVCDRLAADYHVARETLAADVVTLVQALAAEGLVRLNPPADGALGGR